MYTQLYKINIANVSIVCVCVCLCVYDVPCCVAGSLRGPFGEYDRVCV